MQLYIDREILTHALANIQNIIEKRSTHPLLSHVCIEAEGEMLRLTATDTEVAYIGSVKANVSKEGGITVDAANLFQIVRALPQATVELSVSDNFHLQVQCGRSDFKLPGCSPEDYPALPSFEEKGSAKITEGALRRLVEHTVFSVATDDVRYGLNGVYMEDTTNNGTSSLRFVATDGHRLSSSQCNLEGTLHITPKTLIPRKALNVMKRLLDGEEDLVEVAFGEGCIKINRTDEHFWFRLLDGEFPDYRSVIPAESKFKAVLNRQELMSTLKRVSILVSDRARSVKFSFDKEELEIQTHNTERGEVTETLSVEWEGDAISVGFNARYLQDILSVIHGETVTLELAHALSPCLVKNPEETDAFFVVMPMRLD